MMLPRAKIHANSVAATFAAAPGLIPALALVVSLSQDELFAKRSQFLKCVGRRDGTFCGTKSRANHRQRVNSAKRSQFRPSRAAGIAKKQRILRNGIWIGPKF